MLSNIIVLIGIASNGNDNILVDKTRVAYILITRYGKEMTLQQK